MNYEINSIGQYLLIVMSSGVDSFTDGKPCLSAFDRYHFHKKWTSLSKVMAESNWCLDIKKFYKTTKKSYPYPGIGMNFVAFLCIRKTIESKVPIRFGHNF